MVHVYVHFKLEVLGCSFDKIFQSRIPLIILLLIIFFLYFLFSLPLSFSLLSILYLSIVLIIIKSVLGSRRVKKNRSTSFSLPITIDIYCSSLFPFFYLVPRLLLTLKSLFTYTLKIITRPSFFLSSFLSFFLSLNIYFLVF